MPNCRRAFIPGGCFFFTVDPMERRQTLLVDEIAGLREAVATTWRDYPFTIDAFVVSYSSFHRDARGTVSGGLRRRHRNDRRFWGAPVIAGRPSRRCFTRGIRGLAMVDYASRAALGADPIGYNPPYSLPHWQSMSATVF